MATKTRRNSRHPVETAAEAAGAPRPAGRLQAQQQQVERRTRRMEGANTNSTSTNSSSRSGYQHNLHHHPRRVVATHQQENKTRAAPANLAVQPARMKRPLEIIDSNQDPLKSKRARIAVEILAARARSSALSPSSKTKPAIALLSSSSPRPPHPPTPVLHQQTLHHHFRPILPQQQQHHQQRQHQHQHHPVLPPSTAPAAPTPRPPLQAVPAAAAAARPSAPTQIVTTNSKVANTSTTTTIAITQEPQQLPTRQPPQPPLSSGQEPPLNTSTTASHAQPPVTKHHKKVVNGIKHELHKLQPSAADASSATGSTGRKLRSQEATRFKSELAAYFPDYDEVIGNDPKEQHLLNPDTPIVVVDSRLSSTKDAPAPQTQHSTPIEDYPVRSYGDQRFTELVDAQCVDFAFLEHRQHDGELEDSLPDSMYQPSHRKAERLEKSIRNTERSRAQHEKDQIVRLLSDLQGHDWLRIMGVNGVTETRKKSFEPAREHFIKGCQAILGKFRHWSQEEKRRKLEKERALVEEEETAEDDDDDSNADEELLDAGSNADLRSEDEEAEDQSMQDIDMSYGQNDDEESDGDPPDSSDVDASIAKQLRDEAALARAKYHKAHPSKRARRGSPSDLPEMESPGRHREFTSFFDKRHQRDAALNRSRRRGRSAIAWGHGIPELEVDDFELPEEFRDPEMMKTRERQKRRARREARH